jgi:hypothetical protein
MLSVEGRLHNNIIQHQELSCALENGKIWVPKVEACYGQDSVNGSLVQMEVAKASAASTLIQLWGRTRVVVE